MRRSMFPLVFCALAFPLPGLSQERPPGLVAVGDRVFLAPGQPDRQPSGHPPADATWTKVVIDLGEMDWVWEVVGADPLLAPYRPQMQIQRLPDRPSALFRGEGSMGKYGNRERVPVDLRHDDLDTMAETMENPPNEFMFRPAGDDPDYIMTCHAYTPSPEGVPSRNAYCWPPIPWILPSR